VGVRASFMVRELQDLVARHARARRRFEALRDALQPPPSLQGDPEDWVLLNKALGEDDRTLRWFDTVKDDSERQEAIGHVAIHLERILVERERWADFGRLHPEPAAEFEGRAQVCLQHRPVKEGALAEMRDAMLASMQQHVRAMAAQFVKGLRAAGREDDARRVREIALSLDQSSEMRAAVDQ
jgi:hypothetical protein